MSGEMPAVAAANQPPVYDERQIGQDQIDDLTPGTQVELVGVISGHVAPVTVEAVGHSYSLGERPDGSRRITPDEMVKANWITFFTIRQGEDGPVYEYEHLAFAEVGLGPRLLGNGEEEWPDRPTWYLRWPADGAS